MHSNTMSFFKKKFLKFKSDISFIIFSSAAPSIGVEVQSLLLFRVNSCLVSGSAAFFCFLFCYFFFPRVFYSPLPGCLLQLCELPLLLICDTVLQAVSSSHKRQLGWEWFLQIIATGNWSQVTFLKEIKLNAPSNKIHNISTCTLLLYPA